MIEFIASGILQLGIFLMSLFAFYGFVRPYQKGWITRRIRTWADLLSQKPKWIQCVAWSVLILGMGTVFTLDRVAHWQRIHIKANPAKTQLKQESFGLALAIRNSVQKDESTFAMAQKYGRSVNDIVERLRIYAADKWPDELQKLYEEANQLNKEQWGRFAELIQKAGEDISE